MFPPWSIGRNGRLRQWEELEWCGFGSPWATLTERCLVAYFGGVKHRGHTLILAMAFLCAACRRVPSASSPVLKAPNRILFVGNSFTYYNGGLENHFRQLAESANPLLTPKTDRAAKGGATLKILQGEKWVHEKIRDGHYDLVILQEDIPELTEHEVAPFFEQVRLFDREIRAAGGRTALFMAWPYERLKWVGLDQIEQAHRAISKELSLPVAPVGAAFRRSLETRPGLAMLGPDREHETIHGTYLAASVIYAVVLGVNPTGLPYCPEGVSAEEASFLQGIAWSTVKDWQKAR